MACNASGTKTHWYVGGSEQERTVQTLAVACPGVRVGMEMDPDAVATARPSRSGEA